jgi:hypothetical protein
MPMTEDDRLEWRRFGDYQAGISPALCLATGLSRTFKLLTSSGNATVGWPKRAQVSHVEVPDLAGVRVVSGVSTTSM